MTQTNERRRFSRIAFDAKVHIKGVEGIWVGRLLDISLKGFMISRPEDWQDAGDQVFSTEIHAPNDGIIIRAEAIAQHVEENLIGFEICRIDIDSATDLRRLVELNVGDESLLQRELAEMCKHD